MRSLALAAALLLVACRVDVDGAPCAGPGTTSDCPGGQACGNDLRCSARALACAPSRCTPGEKKPCSGSIASRCGAADPVCGAWQSEDCAGRGMGCGQQGSDACECPAYAGTTLVADPSVPSVRGMAPFPTGQEFPPECRFGRLSDALAAASALGPEPSAVRIEADVAVTTAFGAATGETWPLVVEPNVTVAAAPDFRAVIRGEAGADPILLVQGALDGVRVEGGGASGAGVGLSCGAAGAPSLRHVSVDGGGALERDSLSTGVRVGCSARLTGVEVAGVAGAALEVLPDPAAAATVEVRGGSFGASRIGVWTRGGSVILGPDPEHASSGSSTLASESAASPVVSGNTGDGILVGGKTGRAPLSPNAVDVSLEQVRAEANGGLGILVAGLKPAPRSRIAVTRCDVRANGAAGTVEYGTFESTRGAGGVLLVLPADAELAFHGNRLWSNAGDQLAFETGTATTVWEIGAPACGAETNVLCAPPTCGDEGGVCALSVLGAGSVRAGYTRWPASPGGAYATLNAVSGPDSSLTCCVGGQADEPPSPCP